VRPAWSTECISGEPELHKETLSRKTTTTTTTKYTQAHSYITHNSKNATNSNGHQLLNEQTGSGNSLTTCNALNMLGQGSGTI
jgi:hydroxyethylthiazole kinase-like sugar kinase family protein